MIKPSIMLLGWRPRIIHGCSEPCWATLVRIKAERFPWLQHKNMVVAAIKPNRQTVLLDLPELDEEKLERTVPFCSFNDHGMNDLPTLAAAMYWPDCEALYSRYFDRDMLSGFSLTQFIPELVKRFERKRMPGWNVVNRFDKEIVLVKDFADISGMPVAVAVSSNGATIYSRPMNKRSRFLVNEKYSGQHIDWKTLNIAALQTHLKMWDAIEIANQFKSLRWWYFKVLVDELSLPF